MKKLSILVLVLLLAGSLVAVAGGQKEPKEEPSKSLAPGEMKIDQAKLLEPIDKPLKVRLCRQAGPPLVRRSG